MSKWIRVYEYAKKHDKPLQTIYRWIREGKIPKEKVKVEKFEVERILVQED